MHIDKKRKGVNPTLLFLPLLLLAALFLFLYLNNALNAMGYVQIQKVYFLKLNSVLSSNPKLEYNLTEFGDPVIILSLLSSVILKYSKFRKDILSATCVSLILARLPKALIFVPRPAVILDQHSFTVIGPLLTGSSSFPSGHSITIFTTLVVLMFNFMPIKMKHKALWCSFIVLTGLFMASSRVGVGAHFPFDVISGCILGYISAVVGMLINQKYNLWSWIDNRRYFPIFIILMLTGCLFLAIKMATIGLIIFYFAFVLLFISSCILTRAYVKKYIRRRQVSI